jgi:hypothetical protein
MRARARSLWSHITNTRFLTLLIAVGTLATAYVAYQSERDTQEQVQLLKRQVDYNSSETRPFLRLKPNIPPGKATSVYLDVINLGRIPARVIAYDMLVQLGDKLIEPKGGTVNTQDVLYPDQPGMGVFQTLTPEEAQNYLRDSAPIVVGGCVIYGSITADDPRRWKASAAYHFDSHSELPRGLLASEAGVPTGTDKCDASSLRDEWAAQLKVNRKGN